MLRIGPLPRIDMEQPQRLLMVSMLVLSLTAIAIRAQASSETADNRKYTGIGSTAVTISTPNTDVSASRPVRFVQPNGLFGFFGTLRSIKKLYDEQYNDTLVTLQKVSSTVDDQFSDTATPKPAVSAQLAVNSTATAGSNSTSTTAKPEKYRISRQELGYILGKNYRGLRKLLRLELDDAANQTRISLKEYRREFGRALSPYVIPKVINATTTTTTEKST